MTSSPRQPSAPDGPTGKLCTFLASTTLDQVPSATRERAKYLLLDGIACLLLGAHLPWSETAVHALCRTERDGECIVAGWGISADPASATMLNSSFIQGFELDDYFPRAPLHSAAVVLPSLLAAAEARGTVTGEEFLLAAILGFETGTRVGLALGGRQMLTRGWHSGAVFGGLAAAAAAGKLGKLSAASFEDALGIAATQAGGLMAAQFGSMAKRMQHGFAARNGYFAAVLAAGGYTGIQQVFEQPYGGFLSCFGAGHSPDPEQVARELGSRWDTDAIAIKPYAAMGGVHAAIDAVLMLRRQMQHEDDFDLQTIARVELDMGDAAFHHGGFPIEPPIVPVTAQMSVLYSTAVALIDGAAMIEQYSPDRINRDDVWALVRKSTARHHPAFDSGHGFTTRVTLHFTDGTSLEQVVDVPRGALNRPLPNEDVLEKAKLLLDRVVDKNRRDELLEAVARLETVDVAKTLFPLLRTPVKPPFREAP